MNEARPAVLALALCLVSTTALALDVPRLKGFVNDYADLLSPSAESRISDKLEKLRADTGAQVVVLTIDGLEGEYRVLDRMPSRWRMKIDIYMGEDVGAAKAWGKRKVKIRWRAPSPKELTTDSQ